MDRLLTQVRSRSLLFLFPSRKANSFELKPHALFNLVKQFDASKQNSFIPSTDFHVTYELNSIFPLPGRVGFVRETQVIPKLDTDLYDKSLEENQEEFVSKLFNNNNTLEVRTYDCPSSLRSQLHHLFLNYDILTQPLTAIMMIFKTNYDMSTWSVEVENERNQLIEEFTKLSDNIGTYLNTKQYWVDFIDPSNGKPYYGPPTSDVLFETDERLGYFGINTVDLGCCRVIEHLQYGKTFFRLDVYQKNASIFIIGTHVFVGCIFTSVPKHLLKELFIANCSKQE